MWGQAEPVKSQFGYHLIEVLEKDAQHPLDEVYLPQNKYMAWQIVAGFDPPSSDDRALLGLWTKAHPRRYPDADRGAPG